MSEIYKDGAVWDTISQSGTKGSSGDASKSKNYFFLSTFELCTRFARTTSTPRWTGVANLDWQLPSSVLFLLLLLSFRWSTFKLDPGWSCQCFWYHKVKVIKHIFHKLWLYPLQMFWWSVYKMRLKLASSFISREDSQCDPCQLEVIETWYKYKNQQDNSIKEKWLQDSYIYIYPEVRYNNITIELWKPKRSQTIMFSENTRGLIYRLAASRPSWWYIGQIFTTMYISKTITIWPQMIIISKLWRKWLPTIISFQMHITWTHLIYSLDVGKL